jgi:hypothetical protein
MKNPDRTGLAGPSRSRRRGCGPPRKPAWGLPYSLTAETSAACARAVVWLAGAGVEPLELEATRLTFLVARLPPCPFPALLDSTKSAIRGAISERKRDPLNTP